MSAKNVKAFFEKVEKNKALQEDIKRLDKKAEDNEKEAIAELVKIAYAAGFEFTLNDFIKARAEKRIISANELKKVPERPVELAIKPISPISFSKLCLCVYPSTSF
jgi:predicted ribosomally synthesized peptide with nif11-like leader